MISEFSIFTKQAHAGFFDFVKDMFVGGETIEAAQVATPNSQVMPLLQAAVHPDPNPGKGGGDLAIVGDAALLPENGPSGTIADVEDKKDGNGGQISVYVVRSGDSLGGIAHLFDVTVNTIVWANGLKGGVIQPGQTLIILPISGVQHTVVKGDTLQSLAKKYKADAEEIAQYNALSTDEKLAIGEKVIIPDGTVAPPPSSSPTKNRVRNVGGPSYEGYYLRPILGGVRTQGLHGYNGVDIGARTGTPILAAAEGDVIISRNYGYNAGYGNYIVVKHANGTQTLYAHLSKNLVSEGTHVVRGQLIGEVGSTGRSTGPHLHFEVRGAKNPF